MIGRQERAHQQLKQRIRDADAHRAAQHGVALAEILHRRSGRDRVAGVGHKRPAEVRQVYVLADAVEQRTAEFLLQLPDLDADRRLGVAQLCPGLGHVLQRCHMQKSVQIADLHGAQLLSAPAYHISLKNQ